jgi:hypothetical protein
MGDATVDGCEGRPLAGALRNPIDQNLDRLWYYLFWHSHYFHSEKTVGADNDFYHSKPVILRRCRLTVHTPILIFTNQDRLFRRCRLTAHTPIDRLLERVDGAYQPINRRVRGQPAPTK